jgi:hypothetical protein
MIIYGHSSNSMDFWTNAGKRMTIDSGGQAVFYGDVTLDSDSTKVKLGDNQDLQLYHDGSNSYIETTTGSAGDLYIKAQGTNHDLYLQTADQTIFRKGTAEAMRINDEGYLGIGTTDPDFHLDIAASGSGVQLQIGRTSSNVGSTWMGADSNGFHLGVGAYGAGNSVSNPNGFTVTSGGDVEITGGYSSSQSFQSTGSLRVSSNSTATTGNVALELMNDATGTRYLATFTNLNGVVGSISTYANATSYNTSSDYRLKENVVEMTGALNRVNELKPSRFNFIGYEEIVDGFLANRS